MIKIAAFLAVAALAFLTGMTVHHPAPHAAPIVKVTMGPKACTSPSLPSGDQQLVNGVVWTCTDGVWHTR